MTWSTETPGPLPTTPLEIHVATTFAAEPLAGVLEFWTAELGLDAEAVLAPDTLGLQVLLGARERRDAGRDRIQVLLVRLSDLVEPARAPSRVRDAVRVSHDRHAVPHLVLVCPSLPDPSLLDPSPDGADPWLAAEAQLADALREVPGVHVTPAAELVSRYPLAGWRDPLAERPDRVPYTPEAFAALGTMIARAVHAQFTPRPRVVVAGCDDTLWDGVLAEDGPSGVRVPPARRELQELLASQVRAGRLLCLSTHNDPADVASVLTHHPDMALRATDVTAVQAGWWPTSVNLRSLADELELGLDGFVLLSASPVEIAEVRAHTPAVTALRVPADARDAVTFLRNCWALDHPRVAAEDAAPARARAPRQQRPRRLHRRRGERTSRRSPTLADFLDRLELEVTIRPAGTADADRVAQLTQRVTQLNLSGTRRTPDQVAQLAHGACECLVVDVADQFGAYGLAGVMVFADDGAALRVDTFLLSSRALGRGVEHRMVAHLGSLARERGRAEVALPYVPAARNALALDFLAELGGHWRDRPGHGRGLCLPAAQAAAVSYAPGAPPQPVHAPAPAASEQFSRIATELATPARVLAAAAARRAERSVPATTADPEPQRTPPAPRPALLC